MNPSTRTLSVGTLTRVEGEGALRVSLKDGQLESVELNIYEPPRFFEAFLRGRAHTEPPDLTARVCGICPVAYQVSACNAIEDACGVEVDEELVALRRLLYCGEWIHSHVLHIYLLHAPDFLGYPGAVELARDHRPVVERGLSIKKAGNELLKLTLAQPAGFGCPCHGGQYDTEGNRTAGPPVRGLDRYEYSIKNGHLIVGSAYSVDYVRGTGKDARIKKYPLHNPGQHVAGPEFWLWPIPELRA